MTTRPFRELSAFECVLAVADRYDVEVRILPSRGSWAAPRGAAQGPAGHYTKVREKRVYLEASVLDLKEAATEFHEVVHCIFAPPPEAARLLAPEHFGLLQYELALAHVVFAHVPRQIDDVRAYQGITFVDDTRRVGDWPRYERTRWWRAGFALAKDAGLVDDDGKPTWAKPRWPALASLRAHVERCRAAVSCSRLRRRPAP